ncbi:MAG: alpha/beta hydrolase [Isosphaeraceae bacterium]|nr:MAG: alpha/beta hydrolase [Isosphaeraceae bacterium]
MRIAPGRRKRLGLIPDLGVSRMEALLTRTGRVEVVRIGRGDPLVLLPGLAGGWRLLVPLARRLARTHEVVMVGLRGDRGLLDGGGGLTPRDHAEEVGRILDGLRLERPWLIGVSFGGAVALEVALARGRQVGGLVLTGTAARYRGGLFSTIAQGVLARFPLPSDNQFVNQFFNLLHGGRPDSPRLAQFVVERCWETDQGVILGRMRRLNGFDVTDRLGQLSLPTLVLAGMRDVVVDPRDQLALAEAVPAGRRVCLEGAGHIGFLTHRDEFARRIDGFVRSRGMVRR